MVEELPPKKKKKKPRCKQCKKKLRLLSFTCKCGKTFCLKHRYAQDHQCQYDYKTTYTKKYLHLNPKIISEKIIPI